MQDFVRRSSCVHCTVPAATHGPAGVLVHSGSLSFVERGVLVSSLCLCSDNSAMQRSEVATEEKRDPLVSMILLRGLEVQAGTWVP